MFSFLAKSRGDYRAYRDRKNYSKLKAKADKMETKMIYFLQQIEDSSDSLLRAQKGHKNVDLKKDGVVVIKEGRCEGPEAFWQPSTVERLTSEDEEALASQQETQMIFFIQQINSSWTTLLEHTKKHRYHNSAPPPSPPTSPKTLGVQVLPKEPPPNGRHHDRAPASNAPRVPQQRSFEVRPREVVLAEMHSKESSRSSRSYRKEIWSAGDETYLKHFADEKMKKESKDQERRIRDMLSIVEGNPSDSDERTDSLPKETTTPAANVAKTRDFFENQVKPPEPKPVVRRTKSSEWKPKPVIQEPPKKKHSAPPLLKDKPVREKPKPIPQNQADLVRIALAQQKRPRSIPEPVQEMPPIPPPDYKLPPEKLGYLRHVTPRGHQVMPDDFHVEDVHLKHAYRTSTSPPQSERPRYSHMLRKTGKRGELGLDDDDESDVTRIYFNVPLIGVS